jgi:hypothetical protein
MASPPKIVDDPTVRDVYSNQIASASYDGAVFSLTLACVHNVGEQIGEIAAHNEAVVNNRLCIPDAVAVELHTILGAAIEKMRERKIGTTSVDPALIQIKPKSH